LIERKSEERKKRKQANKLYSFSFLPLDFFFVSASTIISPQHKKVLYQLTLNDYTTLIVYQLTNQNKKILLGNFTQYQYDIE